MWMFKVVFNVGHVSEDLVGMWSAWAAVYLIISEAPWDLTWVTCQSHQGWIMRFLAQENYINLPGLLFSCKYKVTVHMLTSKRRSKDESTTFLTPSCATIRSKTHKHIPCPGEGGECLAVWLIKGIGFVQTQRVSIKMTRMSLTFGNCTDSISGWEFCGKGVHFLVSAVNSSKCELA